MTRNEKSSDGEEQKGKEVSFSPPFNPNWAHFKKAHRLQSCSRCRLHPGLWAETWLNTLAHSLYFRSSLPSFVKQWWRPKTTGNHLLLLPHSEFVYHIQDPAWHIHVTPMPHSPGDTAAFRWYVLMRLRVPGCGPFNLSLSCGTVPCIQKLCHKCWDTEGTNGTMEPIPPYTMWQTIKDEPSPLLEQKRILIICFSEACHLSPIFRDVLLSLSWPSSPCHHWQAENVRSITVSHNLCFKRLWSIKYWLKRQVLEPDVLDFRFYYSSAMYKLWILLKWFHSVIVSLSIKWK